MFLAGREWIGIGLDGRRFHWMDWTARQWNGLDWNEPDSTSEDWTGRHALHWTGLSYSELDFTRLHYTALPWIELESTIQDSHCTSLDWSTPNFQMKLIKTVLLCTWMYSTGLDHTGLLSTAMEVSLKDYSGLPKLQWSRWQYINLHLIYMQKDC